MQILVEIGHDELFECDLERMGFIAASLEMDLRKALGTSECPDVSLTAIIYDRNSMKSEVLKFTVGKGGEKHVIPSYLTFLEKLNL